MDYMTAREASKKWDITQRRYRYSVPKARYPELFDSGILGRYQKTL